MGPFPSLPFSELLREGTATLAKPVQYQQWEPIGLRRARNLSAICEFYEQRRSLTDTGYGLCLIQDLRTKEVLLADDKDSEYCSTEHRNLHGTQEEPDHTVDPPHLLGGGAICALDQLLNLLILISMTEVLLPLDLEDLVPHGCEREDGGDAASSCEECGRVGGELVWCGDYVDVVLRAASQRRERFF